jgi:hypothetical protein
MFFMCVSLCVFMTFIFYFFVMIDIGIDGLIRNYIKSNQLWNKSGV